MARRGCHVLPHCDLKKAIIVGLFWIEHERKLYQFRRTEDSGLLYSLFCAFFFPEACALTRGRARLIDLGIIDAIEATLARLQVEHLPHRWWNISRHFPASLPLRTFIWRSRGGALL